jgi:hypothetical protein
MQITLNVQESIDLIAFAMREKHGIEVATVEEENRYGYFKGFVMEVPIAGTANEPRDEIASDEIASEIAN